MSEARILAAFWNRGQKRFCELLGSEITARSGCTVTSADFMSLRMRKFILAQRVDSLKDEAIYRLTPSGEARVSAMVVMNTLPKSRTLTAIPKEKADQ